MNRYEFFKELYFKELDKRNEINNSLSLPIGLITAVVAGIFYLLTNFDYRYYFIITILFSVAVIAAISFLVASIYHLIKAYTDFPKGYEYSLIADANDIEDYYKQLKEFYSVNPSSINTADHELESYVLTEIIKNTDDNQKNNKRKNKFRYNCEKYLIAAFILLCLSLPFFGINYALKTDKKEPIEVKVIYPEKFHAYINSTENRKFVSEFLKDSIFMRKDIHTNISRPVPPPSQSIMEGEDPKPKGR